MLFPVGGAGLVFERAAGVVAAVGCVDDDDKAAGGSGRGLGEGGDGKGEDGEDSTFPPLPPCSCYKDGAPDRCHIRHPMRRPIWHPNGDSISRGHRW